MSTFILTFFSGRFSCWLAVWLLWLLGGSGLAYGQGTSPFAVRVTPAAAVGLSGGQSQLLTATAVYPAFSVGTGFDGPVLATAVQADGKILVGGSFAHYKNISCGNFARLNADGSFDTSFTTGYGITGLVYAITVQQDQSILIGGGFNAYDGVDRYNLVRVLPTGLLDQSFNPSGTSATGLNNTVRAIAVQATGDVVVGGEFTGYGSNSGSGSTAKYLVRFSSTGVFDNAFATATHVTTNYFNDAVLALKVQSSGNILVGGRFTRPTPTGPGRQGIARLSSLGVLDPTFAIGTGSGPTTGEIDAIADFSGGILVGGNFTGYSGNTSYKCLALLTSTGELDAANFAALSLATTALSPRVTSLVVQDATAPAAIRIVVGGLFTAYTSYTNLVGLSNTGSLDPAFGVGTGFTTFDIINSLAAQPNGYIVVGGNFTTYKGTSAKRIARLKPTGSFDDIDVPIAGATYQWNGPVTAAATTAKSATAQASTTGLYSATATVSGVGGPITSNAVAITVAAVPLAPIAVRVVPVGPLALGAGQSQPLVAQTVYPAFSVSTGFNDQVKALAVQPDGKLLVGGSFTAYNNTPRKYIARLNADGSLDNTFTSTGAGFNDVITSLAVQPDGKVLVGGDFTSYNNGAFTRRHVARLNIDGSLDASFAANGWGFSNSTTAFAVQPDGSILVIGNFPSYVDNNNVTLAAVNYVARLKPNGERDSDFAFGSAGFSDYTTALALQPDGKVLVGGHFASYNGTTRNGVARLNADGSLDTSFAPTTNFNNDVTALALQPDGKVLVGSAFTNYVVRLNTDGSLDTNFAPIGTASSFVSVLALQPNGKLLVGGANHLLAVTNGLLVRFDPNGVRDPTFASNTGFGPAGDKFTGGYASSLALQPDGKVLALGTFNSYNGTANVNRIARLTEAGVLNNADVPVAGATYAWSNGSTGDTLTVNTSGLYSATGTFLGQTATSNAVTVTVGNAPAAAFTVRMTPAGPLSLCASGAGSSQTLTAQVAGTTATYTYEWWRVQKGTAVPLGSGTPYPTGNPTASTYSVNTPGQYFATATTGTGTAARTAASPTITVVSALPPSLTSPSPSTPVTGLPGASVVLTGPNLGLATAVLFGTGASALTAAFVVDSPTQLTATVPAGATTGPLSIVAACTTYVHPAGFSLPPAAAPTIVSFAPQAATAGSTIVLTGSGFINGTGATTVTLNGQPVSATVISTTQLTAVVPPNTAAGPNLALTVTTAAGSASVALTVYAATAMDRVINTTVTLPPKSVYNSLRIVAPGKVTVAGSAPTDNLGLTVNQLEVQAGATLNVTEATVVVGSSPGSSFLLAAGATLNVGHPNGISSYPAPGAIQVKKRFFSSDASYGYTGSQAQATGDTLPSQVRNLTSANARGLTLSRPVSIAQVLTMSGAGHFYLNNQPLTILSGPTGTGLVVNDAGAGRVLGTATVQRYINPVANNGVGFRYYGSPVKGATAAVLAATVFDYDQGRAFVQQDTLPLISYGFAQGALAPNTALRTGRGYRAVVPAATTVKFTGTLTTGDTTLTLTRTGNADYNGWNLVSNPYPAPLNWTSLLAAGDAQGLDAAIYIYESTGTGTGRYRSYVNGISNEGLVNQFANGNLLIPMGQAFFVRVRKDQPTGTGTLTFRNAHRVTTYAEQAYFSRTAAAPRFELSAALRRPPGSTHGGGSSGGCSGCTHSDRIALYVDSTLVNDASHPFNGQLFDISRDADASDLFSFSQQTLSIQGGAGIANGTFAIRAVAQPLASLAAAQVVPLVISATAPGAYELQIAIKALPKLGTLVPYLRDKSLPVNNQLTDLTAAGAAVFVYPFTLSAIDILNGISTRFEIVFVPSTSMATSPGSGLSGAVVYPNPTQHRIHVWMPALPGATQVQATLFNSLGQVVRRQNALLSAAGNALDLDAERLAGGVYILRLQAGGTTTTRRVVLEN